MKSLFKNKKNYKDKYIEKIKTIQNFTRFKM